MCTISYLPLPAGGFLLTQNRDESPQRPAAVFPTKEARQGKNLLFPKDPLGGGSWIATDEKERLVCLMNGAFGQHESQPPYRLSRGQVVLDAAASGSFQDFAAHYPLQGIEPFTLLFFEAGAKEVSIHELKWDGLTAHPRQLPSGKPCIWSAPQLYNPAQQQSREEWFRAWLQTAPAFTPQAALSFHVETGKNAPHSLLLNREERVKTVSITQAVAQQGLIRLTYLPAPGKKRDA